MHVPLNPKNHYTYSAIGESPDEAQGETLLEPSEKVAEPPQYCVVLLNDDYTTFDFVVHVLITIFNKPVEEAVIITNNVHKKGRGVCGVYTKQIAETKVDLVDHASREAGYPLKCIMEEA